MPAHTIHLRRAWQVVGGGRVDLPILWPPGPSRRVTLTRRFHRPEIDPAREALHLEMQSVPGLAAVRLNGQDLGLGRGGGVWRAPIEMTAASLLELEVEIPQSGGPWGHIAILIERL